MNNDVILINKRVFVSQASALKVSTPLTGRRYVPESSAGTPVSMAMQSVGRLHTLLTGFKYRPSMRLRDIFR